MAKNANRSPQQDLFWRQVGRPKGDTIATTNSAPLPPRPRLEVPDEGLDGAVSRELSLGGAASIVQEIAPVGPGFAPRMWFADAIAGRKYGIRGSGLYSTGSEAARTMRVDFSRLVVQDATPRQIARLLGWSTDEDISRVARTLGVPDATVRGWWAGSAEVSIEIRYDVLMLFGMYHSPITNGIEEFGAARAEFRPVGLVRHREQAN